MSAMGPFAEPVAGCTPAAPPALTADQESTYDQLLAVVQSWETIPTTSAKTAESSSLSDDERMWLTRECLLRYLRATKWNLAQATLRLRSTLIWRREYGTDRFTADYISEENETGKQVLLGFDNEGRPCLYLLPQNQNTKDTPKRVEHLVYMLERTIDLHPPGQESLALLIDFRNTGAGGTPSLGTAKQVLDILQNHYPERLGRSLLTHLPWYVNAFLKLVNPFIDPVTKTKIKSNEPLPNHVPSSQLMKVSGGDVDFRYDHAVYWPALEKITQERKQQRKARWEKAGKLIGESEVYLWGGAEGSIGSTLLDKKEQPAVSDNEEQPAVPDNKEQSAVPEIKEKPEIVDSKEQPAVSDSKEQPAVLGNNGQPKNEEHTSADTALTSNMAKLDVKDGEAGQTIS